MARYQCWLIDASSCETTDQGFEDIANEISRHNFGSSREVSSNKIAFARKWLTETNEGWMLIFDNADPDIGLETNYFPDNPQGIILINGRRRELKDSTQAIILKDLELGPLEEEYAIRILTQRLGDGEVQASDLPSLCLIRKIVNDLDRTPLAIEIASSLIKKNRHSMPLLKRLEIYVNEWDKWSQGQKVDTKFELQSRQVQVILDSIWNGGKPSNASTESRNICSDAFAFLQLVICLGSESLPLSVLKESWTKKRPDMKLFPPIVNDTAASNWEDHKIHRAIDHVYDHSLISLSKNSSGGSDSEVLLNTWIRGQINAYMREKDMDFLRVSLSAVTLLSQAVSWEHSELHWTLYRKLEKHLKTALIIPSKRGVNFEAALLQSEFLDTGISVLLRIGILHFQAGYLQDAERIQVFAMLKARSNLSSYHPTTLRAKSDLATTYMVQDRTGEASDLRNEVLKVRQAIHKGQSDLRFTLSCTLKNVYYTNRHRTPWTWNITRPEYCVFPFEGILRSVRADWAMKILRKNSVVRHRNLLNYRQTMMDFADSQAALTNLDAKKEALKSRRHVAYGRTTDLRKTDINVTPDQLLRRIEATRKTALSLRDLREWRMALLLRKKVFNLFMTERYRNIFEQQDDPLLLFQVRQDLAESYTDLGYLRKAEGILEDALKTLQQSSHLPSNHLQVTLAWAGMARICSYQDELPRAQHIYELVEQKFTELFGQHHRLSLGASKDVARVLHLRGNRDALQKQRSVLQNTRDFYKDDESEQVLASIEKLSPLLESYTALSSIALQLQAYVVNTRAKITNANTFSNSDSYNAYIRCLMRNSKQHVVGAQEHGVCKTCHRALQLRFRNLEYQMTQLKLKNDHFDVLTTISALADDYEWHFRVHSAPKEDRPRPDFDSYTYDSYTYVSTSISEKDPANSETVASGDSDLLQTLQKEWCSFLKGPEVRDPLVTSTPWLMFDFKLPIYDGSETLSIDQLRHGSISLRRYVLECTLARVLTITGTGMLATFGDVNHYVKQAEKKLHATERMFDLKPPQARDLVEERIKPWLDNVPEEVEDPETRLTPPNLDSGDPI